MDTCPLCDIKNQKYRIIEENEHAIASIIKWPLKEGHTMIIPKRHVKQLSDLEDKELKSTINLMDKIKLKISRLYSDSPAIHINSGANSTQEHVHIHVLPSKGSLRHLFSQYENVPFREDISDEEKSIIAEKIRNVKN